MEPIRHILLQPLLVLPNSRPERRKHVYNRHPLSHPQIPNSLSILRRHIEFAIELQRRVARFQVLAALVRIDRGRRKKEDARVGGVPRGRLRSDHLDHPAEVGGEFVEGDVLRGGADAGVVRAEPEGEEAHGWDVVLLVLLREELEGSSRRVRVRNGMCSDEMSVPARTLRNQYGMLLIGQPSELTWDRPLRVISREPSINHIELARIYVCRSQG